MRTAVSGIIKIGQTDSANYEKRMKHLEKNGFGTVTGLKRFFAIELTLHTVKEKLLNEIFSTHQVGGSELFALDSALVKQLLLAFDGRVVFPKGDDKEKEFGAVSKTRKQGMLCSFYKKGLKDGTTIIYC